MRRTTILLLAGVILNLSMGRALAAVYDVDPVHSHVGFRIRHFTSKVNGEFRTFVGTINFDPDHPKQSTAEGTIQTISINTDNEKRDAHLRSKDFFKCDQFPTISFKTTGAQVIEKDKVRITADFTMLGITKPITLDVEVGGLMNAPGGETRAGFSITGMINRKDFGMNYNIALDRGGLMIGDEVALQLDIEAVQKK